MGDTSRGLLWAIERRCSLRRDRDWQLPLVTHRQLRDLRPINKTVFEGICITAHTYLGTRPDLPYSGFPVERAMARFGGEGGVRATCAACEANVGDRGSAGIVGCHEYLKVDPDSPELDEALRDAADRFGLTGRLSRLFTMTTPLWHGFWIDSPLDRERLQALAQLFGEASVRWASINGGDHFVRAVRAAGDAGLALHARLDPPGHIDLGWYSVYAHCPRCMAAVQDPGPTSPHQCRACGHVFNPISTERIERDGRYFSRFETERASLLDQLGTDGWREFAGRYLLQRGYLASDVEQHLQGYLDWVSRHWVRADGGSGSHAPGHA